MRYVDSVSMVSIRMEFLTMAIDVGIARVNQILETYVLYRNPPPARSVGRTAEFTGGGASCGASGTGGVVPQKLSPQILSAL